VRATDIEYYGNDNWLATQLPQSIHN